MNPRREGMIDVRMCDQTATTVEVSYPTEFCVFHVENLDITSATVHSSTQRHQADLISKDLQVKRTTQCLTAESQEHQPDVLQYTPRSKCDIDPVFAYWIVDALSLIHISEPTRPY